MGPDTATFIFKAKIRTGALFCFSLFANLGMLLTACGDTNGTEQNVHSNAVIALTGPNGY